MSKSKEELLKEIFAMMDYVGEQHITVRINMFGPLQPYLDGKEKVLRDDDNDVSTHDLYKIHDMLQVDCREKAVQKWVDIDLANNNLFWCCSDG